ncbi:MAG: sigma-70 family RNA polymerase sigma factor [Deltaproteobacteria bacterium]|nr:sigma-70 family RNA polymerase sigma factor [Deltaproteobacteria bacterium]
MSIVRGVESSADVQAEPTSHGAVEDPSPLSDRELDASLLAASAEGDTAAFRRLVDRHQRRAHAIAYGLVRNPDDAREVVQEAFIRVFKHRGDFAGQASFSTWMYRIVVNLSIDRLRKRTGKRFIELDDSVDLDGAPTELLPRRDEVNPFANLDRSRLVEAMQKALDELPPYHRAVILLRELEGMSYEEMAQTLDISKGTIMSRLFHARRKMQRSLKELLGDEVPDVKTSDSDGEDS